MTGKVEPAEHECGQDRDREPSEKGPTRISDPDARVDGRLTDSTGQTSAAAAALHAEGRQDGFERSWLARGPARLVTDAGRQRWRETVQDVIDHQEQWLERVGEYLERAGGDRAYSVWLHLVDHHLESMASPAGLAPEPMRAAYEQGWSPHETATVAVRAADRPELLEAYGLGADPAVSPPGREL